MDMVMRWFGFLLMVISAIGLSLTNDYRFMVATAIGGAFILLSVLLAKVVRKRK